MMKKILICLFLLSILSIGSIAEAKSNVYIGSWFGWWGQPSIAISGKVDSGRFFVNTGFPFWWGHPGFNIFFSKRIDDRILFSASLPVWWDYDSYYYYPYRYYYPHSYGRVIIKDPEPVENFYRKGSYTPDVTEKEQDMILYSGIQIYPAGRVKITASKGISDQPEMVDIEIDGLPSGKIGEKPFEMGLLVGRHKIIIKKDGKEVFSTDINVERNKEISLKIDIEGLNK